MRIRVSDLSKFILCPKRSKIEGLRQINRNQPRTTGVMAKGTQMHSEYSVPYKSFDRRLLRYRLEDTYGRVFTRDLEKDQIRGIPDDYRVLMKNSTQRPSLTKVVSIIEVKTTSKKKLWRVEEDVAVLQLLIYCWLMRPLLENLGYKIHTRHYVEIYSQKTKKLIKRIPIDIQSEKYMEEYIKGIIEVWYGLRKMTLPPRWICKKCPRVIKEKCGYWKVL